MKTPTLLILLFFALQNFALAQKGKSKPEVTPSKVVDFTIPLTPEKWAFQTGKVDFVDYKRPKMHENCAQFGTSSTQGSGL